MTQRVWSVRPGERRILRREPDPSTAFPAGGHESARVLIRRGIPQVRRPDADEKIMRSLPRLTVGLGLALVLVLVGGVAAYLAYTAKAAEKGLRADFAKRALLAGNLTGTTLNASDSRNRQFAEASLAGPEDTLQAALAAAVGSDAGVHILLGSDGTVLATTHESSIGEADKRKASDLAKRAIESDRMIFGDVLDGVEPFQAMAAVPYSTVQGERVFAMTIELELLATFAEGYLSSALDLAGARAFVTDGNGKVLVTTGDKASLGAPLADRELADALSRASSGHVGGDYFASATVSNSSWRMVFVVPDRVLMAPIESTSRAAWQLFAGFCVTMLLLVVLAAATLSRSARLAHARLHDTLTGLPNRSLFLSLTQRAFAERRRGCMVAALFIDLDGFKPVNDAHGHAAGDALLVAVAQRLTAAMRRDDVVSRFGGDEFLVLCTNVTAECEVMSVADRIRNLVAQPFELEDGLQVTIGSSIGVAVFDDDHILDPAALIHNADLAMYKAKKSGKGRVVRFDPAMAQAGA
jgi:diguanylate cyclase (GGDEF)-like protein